MSTKTSIKRVAVIAAAALTIGGFSAVSAFAATVPGLAASTTTGAVSVTASATYPQDTVAVSATTGTYVLETVTANAADSVYTITSTGTGSVSIANPGTTYPAEPSGDSTTIQYAVSGNTVQWYTGSAPGLGGAFSNSTGHTLLFAVYSATAGTQTLTVSGNNSAAVTQTITWGAAPTVSASYSKSILIDSATTTAAQDKVQAAAAIAASYPDSSTAQATAAAATNGVAVVGVDLYNSLDNQIISGDSLTAQVSGNALVQGTNGVESVGYTGNWSVAGTSTTDSTGYAVWKVSSNGGSGTATITVSYTDSLGNNTVIATKTIVFYSSTIASLKATVNHVYIPLAGVTGYTYAGGGSTADVHDVTTVTGTAYSTTVLPAVSVVASDANANAIPGGATVDVTSSNTAVATVAATAFYSATAKVYVPVITPVAEGTTTLTFVDDATGAIKATAVINVSKAVISTIATATDASSYDPATAVKYSITAKDAAGNLIPDGAYTGFYVAGDEPLSNVGLQGFTPVDTLTTTSGVQTTSFYAPVTPGTTVNIVGGTLPGTAGSSTAGAAFIVAGLNASTQGAASFTVNGGSDASGATDAANAATDAANAAADAADNATQAASEALAAVNSLATTVASLIAGIKAQITSLTNLITKIKNKVGA